MNPRDVYEKLMSDLENGEASDLQRKIFKLLKDNPRGLTRQALVQCIYGYTPLVLDGNTDDRKIRKAIEKLRKRLFPIVSNSGEAGYRLDVSRPAVIKMLTDLRSRRDNLDMQIKAVSKFYDVPVEYEDDPQEAGQLELDV